MRVLIIWIMGIIALSIVGSLVGFALAGNSKGEWAGAIAGTCAFVCLRLWFGKQRQVSD
jgi:hypothetical protein